MPQDIQRGELSDRLRRFGGLTGRIPLTLDEMVVPVVVGEDLYRQPYRLTVRGFNLVDEFAGAAGNPTQLAISLPLPGPVGGKYPGCIVVRRIRLTNLAGAAAQFSLRIGFNQTTTWTTRAQAFDLDRPINQNGSDVRLPVVIRGINTVASAGFALDIVDLGAATAHEWVLDPGIVLPPGVELRTVAPATVVNRSTFWGEYFPDAITYQ